VFWKKTKATKTLAGGLGSQTGWLGFIAGVFLDKTGGVKTFVGWVFSKTQGTILICRGVLLHCRGTLILCRGARRSCRGANCRSIGQFDATIFEKCEVCCKESFAF